MGGLRRTGAPESADASKLSRNLVSRVSARPAGERGTMRIAVHAVGARRSAGAGHNRTLRKAGSFPSLCREEEFLFIVKPEIAAEVRQPAPAVSVLSAPRGLATHDAGTQCWVAKAPGREESRPQ